jgi:hypothetical protein
MTSYEIYPNTEEHCPMTKPTGRPRGRPKTREYVTLMARVDVALADQVKRYASLHRQPLSVVIRDALSLLMEEYPDSTITGPHRLAAHEFLSDRYETPLDTLVGETDSTNLDELLSDRNKAALAIIDADARSDREYLSDTNKDKDILSDTKEDETILYDTNRDTEILSDAKAVPDIVSDTNTPPLHATRHWGEPCGKDPTHVNAATGKTERRNSDRDCVGCHNARENARKAAKRQAAYV